MSRFLLIVKNLESEENKRLADEADTIFDEVKILDEANIKNTAVILKKGSPIKIYNGNIDISNQDIIMIRNSNHERIIKSVLAHAYEKLGANIVDPVGCYTIGFPTKILSSIGRHEKECAPDTYLVFSKEELGNIINSNNTDTFFVKPINGSQSRGTKIVQGYRGLLEAANDYNFSMQRQTIPFYFQKYIDIHVEYRMFFVNGNLVKSMKKIRRDDGSIRYRAMRFRRLAEFVKERISDSGILGVDCCNDTDGNFYIIETNRSPMFRALERVTDTNIAQSVLRSLAGEVVDG